MKQGKLIFEQSKAAKKRIFKSILDKVTERDAALGLPKIYRNQDCVKPSMFVHEYPDGRRFLIEIDITTSEQHVIREFN